MDRGVPRSWIWIGAGLFAGLVVGVGIGLLEGGKPLTTTMTNADVLFVRVENVGHEAEITVTTQPVAGGRSADWVWTIPDGGSQVAEHRGPTGDMRVFVNVAWADAGRSGRGSGTFLADASDCPGEDIILEVVANTLNGVSVSPRGPSRCI